MVGHRVERSLRLGRDNAWINPAAVVEFPLQKTFSAAWVESFVRLLETDRLNVGGCQG